MNNPTPDKDLAVFEGNFTQQEPIPESAIQKAVEVMRGGRLHRYNLAENEILSETSALEVEYAQYQNADYCLALASGGYAIQTALRAVGVGMDEKVLTNGFTLSPVPGAIAAVGAKPVLVECTDDLVIDLSHLEKQIIASNSKFLLLSHMRGHLADMDSLDHLLKEHNVLMIEDCAHTMGASFNGVKSGNHGAVGCFSTQTYKHMNSGEGGFLTTNDAEIMARAVILSGSYMLYERHAAAPPAEVFKTIKLKTPNCSGRMDNLRAAILRPQLESLDDNCDRWNQRFVTIKNILQSSNVFKLPASHKDADEVFSSFQFSINALSEAQHKLFMEGCMQRGVELKWFGAEDPKAYTSRYDSWHYIEPQPLPNTDAVLQRLYDCRIPLTFSIADCQQIAEIIKSSAESVLSTSAAI